MSLFTIYMKINCLSKLSFLNISIPRIYNNTLIKIPLLGGNKVGISNEAWMNDLLKEVHAIKKIKRFYDIGANMGQTLVKVKTIDNSIHYHAFEPNYLCTPYLQKLIRINNSKNTYIYPFGLFNKDSIHSLEGQNDFDKCSSILPQYSDIKHFDAEDYTSKITSFYSYETINNFIGNDKVDIIKIDTEGTELEVITSIKSLIQRDLPLIFIEILPSKKDNQDTILRNQELDIYIRELNYIPYRINKKLKQRFCSLEKRISMGDYAHMDFIDHLLIPCNKVDIYKHLMK